MAGKHAFGFALGLVQPLTLAGAVAIGAHSGNWFIFVALLVGFALANGFGRED